MLRGFLFLVIFGCLALGNAFGRSLEVWACNVKNACTSEMSPFQHFEAVFVGAKVERAADKGKNAVYRINLLDVRLGWMEMEIKCCGPYLVAKLTRLRGNMPEIGTISSEDGVDGYLLAMKENVWFVQDEGKVYRWETADLGRFPWDKLVTVTRLRRNQLLVPEYKLSFTKHHGNYVSFMEKTTDSTYSEYFYPLSSADLDTFSRKKSVLPCLSKGIEPIQVSISNTSDRLFWLGRTFQPSERRFYPLIDYDFGEILED